MQEEEEPGMNNDSLPQQNNTLNDESNTQKDVNDQDSD